MVSQRKISVIGLGYVGLPLAVEFGRKKTVIGFDLSHDRIHELKQGLDRTHEVSKEMLMSAEIQLTTDPSAIKAADFHIITVPTPVDNAKKPDLTSILAASKTVGSQLKRGDIVVYESTVYPGVTEDLCVPVLESSSNLKNGIDFKVGYSPERINPGDREHTLSKIIKVVSGQDIETAEIIAQTYSEIITAGVFKSASIKVAEAAKVIENIQRDLNIALMNELSLIFHKLGIDTQDVLSASRTKWNFLPFSPGLVGGHCIGVDPYYLTHKASEVGYIAQVILSGRKINDEMGMYIAQQTIKLMINANASIKGSTVTVLGLTFKENVPDIRNTKVVDIFRTLKEYGVNVQVCDPLAKADEVYSEYGFNLTPFESLKPAQAVIFAVPHKIWTTKSWDFFSKLLLEEKGVLVDVKGILQRDLKPKDITLWRL